MGGLPHAVDWTPLPVPWAVQAVDRIPKQRYYDPEFYALENELLWPRVWQSARGSVAAAKKNRPKKPLF